MTISGRGDGGCHRFYRRPPGKLSAKRLARGSMSRRHRAMWCCRRRSIPIPESRTRGLTLRWWHRRRWLVELLTPRSHHSGTGSRSISRTFTGPSIADQFGDSTSWLEVLTPHDWTCLDADPDADGARWLHPTATSSCSATVRNGCLFVYSPNTPFDVTETEQPKGYTKFRAYAVLDHNGDLKAAAQALRASGEMIDADSVDPMPPANGARVAARSCSPWSESMWCSRTYIPPSRWCCGSWPPTRLRHGSTRPGW